MGFVIDNDATVAEPVDIQVGVLLATSQPARADDADGDGDLDDPGYAPAFGNRGRRRTAEQDNRVAQLGQDVLRAAAEAIGREINLVVGGVISGLEQRVDGTHAAAVGDASLGIEEVALKFGVKATLGVGKAIEAFFTASGEATVEVTLTLRQPTR